MLPENSTATTRSRERGGYDTYKTGICQDGTKKKSLGPWTLMTVSATSAGGFAIQIDTGLLAYQIL